jgi:hypothetical protein
LSDEGRITRRTLTRTFRFQSVQKRVLEPRHILRVSRQG